MVESKIAALDKRRPFPARLRALKRRCVSSGSIEPRVRRSAFRSLPKLSAPLHRRRARHLAESPGQMRLVGETARLGNLTNRPIGYFQQRRGRLQPYMHQIFGRRQARGATEHSGEMPLTQISERRQLLYGDARAHMTFDVFSDFAHLKVCKSNRSR